MMKYQCNVDGKIEFYFDILESYGFVPDSERKYFKPHKWLVIKDDKSFGANSIDSTRLVTITEKELLDYVVNGKVPEPKTVKWDDIKAGQKFTFYKQNNVYTKAFTIPMQDCMIPNKYYVFLDSAGRVGFSNMFSDDKFILVQ